VRITTEDICSVEPLAEIRQLSSTSSNVSYLSLVQVSSPNGAVRGPTAREPKQAKQLKAPEEGPAVPGTNAALIASMRGPASAGERLTASPPSSPSRSETLPQQQMRTMTYSGSRKPSKVSVNRV
jgi:hypothetical protein